LEEVIISALFSPSFHSLLVGDVNADWRKSLSVHCSHHHFIGCLAATSMLIGGSHYQCTVLTIISLATWGVTSMLIGGNHYQCIVFTIISLAAWGATSMLIGGSHYQCIVLTIISLAAWGRHQC